MTVTLAKTFLKNSNVSVAIQLPSSVKKCSIADQSDIRMLVVTGQQRNARRQCKERIMHVQADKKNETIIYKIIISKQK